MLAARYRTGTVAIDAEIENLKQFCSDFVKSFDDDSVAASGADNGQSDPKVSRTGLDDRATRMQQTGCGMAS